MSVSMSDHYVLLLEKVVEENKALREQMKQMAYNEKTVLGELHHKIDDLKSVNLSRRVRHTGPSLRVPQMCRNDVRRKLKLLEKAEENEFVRLNESFASEHNIKVFNTLVNELKLEYGGDDKCPWTLQQLRGAFKTYIKSRKAQEKRKENNSNESHLTKCRRQARKREKLGKRVRSLENKDWTNEKKAKIMEVLTMDYMSSEESDHESQPPHRTKQYIVRPLLWQSNELKRYKKRLDKGHLDSLPELVKKRTLPRSVGAPSTRNKPDSCPEWACIESTGTPQPSISSSTSSSNTNSSPLSTSSPPLASSTPQTGHQSTEELSIRLSSRRAVLQ